MRCQLARRLIQELLNGESTDSRTNELNAHLAQCARCREEEAALRGLRPLLGALPTHEPLPTYWGDLKGAVLGRLSDNPAVTHPVEAPLRWFRPVMWASAASMCTFAMGLYAGFVMSAGRASAGAARVAATNEKPKTSALIAREPPPTREPVLTPSSPGAPALVVKASERTKSRVTPRGARSDRAVFAHELVLPLADEVSLSQRVAVVYRIESPTLAVTNSEGLVDADTGNALPPGKLVTPVARHVAVQLRPATLRAFVPETARVAIRELPMNAERNEYR